jgi:dimethylargininase
MAITREISSAFDNVGATQASPLLTYLPRVPIDIERARAQHAAYEWALVDAGCTVRRIDSGPDMPDAVFVEDIAVVFRGGAVITRPGAESRRVETPAVSAVLARHGLPLREIVEPATLDGGDVLTIGRQVFIGQSARTNAAGITQMRRLLKPLRYTVRAVPVQGCLHLKSAVTALADDTLLVNGDWVPTDAFAGFTLIDVDPDEPQAANALMLGNVILYSAAFSKTRARLEAHGVRVRAVEVDELAKAEGGVTCCSVIWEM